MELRCYHPEAPIIFVILHRTGRLLNKFMLDVKQLNSYKHPVHIVNPTEDTRSNRCG